TRPAQSGWGARVGTPFVVDRPLAPELCADDLLIKPRGRDGDCGPRGNAPPYLCNGSEYRPRRGGVGQIEPWGIENQPLTSALARPQRGRETALGVRENHQGQLGVLHADKGGSSIQVGEVLAQVGHVARILVRAQTPARAMHV